MPPPLTPTTSAEVWGEPLPEAFPAPRCQIQHPGRKRSLGETLPQKERSGEERGGIKGFMTPITARHTHPCPLAISQAAGSAEHGESFHQQYWHCLGKRSDGRDAEARYSSQINTSRAPAGDIPTRDASSSHPPCRFRRLKERLQNNRFPQCRLETCSHHSSGCRRCLPHLLHKARPRETVPCPLSAQAQEPGLGSREEGWAKEGVCPPPRIPLVDPIVSWWGELPWRWRWEVVLAFWPSSRVPYRSSAGADSQRMSHCSPALRPLPVPVGLRDKQKQSQTLWGGGWTCSPPPDPAATPQAGRQADRQTDARLGGMGRDTPIFSRFCIPTPFLPWAKNTRAGWTGKIITIKELCRRCVQLFPRLSALPLGQDRFLMRGLPLLPWMT